MARDSFFFVAFRLIFFIILYLCCLLTGEVGLRLLGLLGCGSGLRLGSFVIGKVEECIFLLVN